MDASWKAYVEFIKNRGNIEEVLIISSDDGALWATSDADNFYLRKYNAMITQEDGNEKDEVVNEAMNIVQFMKGQKPAQGLRLNGQRKHQITRNFKDETSGLQVIYSKIPNGGACVAHAGKCILIGTFNEAKNHTSPPCFETISMMAMYLAKSTWPDKNDTGGSGGGGSGGGGGGGKTIPSAGSASWQDHIDKSLVGRGHVDQAMLISTDDMSILASTPDFKLQVYQADIPQEDGTDKNETVDEAKNIKQLMNKTKPPQGLRVNQVKYQIIRSLVDELSDCYTVYGKKSLGGIAITITGKVIIIATFDEKKNHNSPGSNENITQLAQYFKKNVK